MEKELIGGLPFQFTIKPMSFLPSWPLERVWAIVEKFNVLLSRLMPDSQEDRPVEAVVFWVFRDSSVYREPTFKIIFTPAGGEPVQLRIGIAEMMKKVRWSFGKKGEELPGQADCPRIKLVALNRWDDLDNSLPEIFVACMWEATLVQLEAAQKKNGDLRRIVRCLGSTAF